MRGCGYDMATILDVAKLAGVSQGTVSNVLNGKGNVSSEKIRMVEEAARQLGFTINERARMLRKGSSNIISVILPNIEFIQYREFYNSLRSYAKKSGYVAELLISNDNPQEELELIQKSRAVMAEGIVTLTCLRGTENPYVQAGFDKVCFVERKPAFEADYFGFDYRLAGMQMAGQVAARKYKNVAVVTATERFSNEREYMEGFLEVMDTEKNCSVRKITTDVLRISYSILNLFDSGEKIDAIITTNMGFAEKIRQIYMAFFRDTEIKIHTLSPVYSLPEKDFLKYELNYSLLGREIAARMIGTDKKEFRAEDHLFDNDGERQWKNISLKRRAAACLNVLTLEGPEANLMKGLAKMYTEKTGTQVNVAVFSYDEIYDQFVFSETSDLFDVLRLDVTWLSWLAERILLPLDGIDPDIQTVFSEYLPSLSDKYAIVNNRVYALPLTPSAQLLFYRKDLFENVAVKRIYSESFKEELRAPADFREFNQIARFFSGGSDFPAAVRYGTNLTLGNTGVAATEFLTRYFSHQENLMYQDGKVFIDNEIGRQAMAELLEAQKYTPARTARWWTDLAGTFADGDVAMVIMFSNYASEILASRSKIVGNIGFGMVPGGNPIVGGGSLGISRNSKKQEDALAYIKWMTKEPISSAMAGLGSVSPCARTYSKYDIIDTFPWLELSKDCFTLSRTKRVAAGEERPFNEKKFLNIIGTAVKNLSMGFISLDEAMERAQHQLIYEL